MKKGRKRKFSQKQRIIIRAERIWKLVHIDGYSYTVAWKKACPVSKAKKQYWGKQAKKDCDLFEKEYGKDLQKLLDIAGLGLSRVVQELSKSLNQKKVELYQGKIVVDEKGNIIHFDDNMIQQKGRELLTKIHGLEKQEMKVTGEEGKPLGIVFLPVRMTPEEWMKEHGSKDSDGMESPAKTKDSS